MNHTPKTAPPTPSQRVARAVRSFFHVVSKNPKTGETEIYLTPLHLIAAVLVLALLVGGILLGVRACTAQPDWTYRIGGTKTTVPGELAKPEDTLYINLDAVASLANLTVTETADEPRFTAPDGSHFKLKADSAEVYVNGTHAQMTAPLRSEEDAYWIPLNFLQTVLTGLDVKIDHDKRTVTVARNTDDVTIRIPSASGEGNDPGPAIPAATYTTDVSAFLPYIDPTDASSYTVLVNRNHPLTASDEPTDLVYLPDSMSADDSRYQVRATVAKALEAMFAEMTADGITDVAVTSAYRPYTYQEWLFGQYVENEKAKDPTLSDEAAEALAATYSAKAGTSEHQTGLCVDFTTQSIHGEVSDAFTQTPAAAWLAENAWKFGFILRFPEEKTELTTFKYESWHYRFVGRTVAAEIHFADQCLEEYLGE